MYDLMFFICSTAGKRQNAAARGARVPPSQSETEKNRSGFRGVKRMLNSLRYRPAEMLRIKTNDPVKVPYVGSVTVCLHISARNMKNSKIEL